MGVEDKVGDVSLPESTVDKRNKVPQVSIGMPVYNGEPFIREALDSLLAQIFTDFELIISDNASTDGTEAICREYAARDERIRYVRQAENLGALSNFELVLTYAESNYFMWIAGDDCFSGRGDLNNLYEKIELGYEYAFPDVNIIDGGRKVIKTNLMSPFKGAVTRFDYLKGSIEVSSHQVYALFKTSSLRDYFPYLKRHRHLPCFGEGLFVNVISLKMNGVFVPEACKLYRVHERNQSRTQRLEALLPAFLEYSVASLHFILLSEDLLVSEKLKLLPKKIFKHTNGFLRIFAALVAQKIPITKISNRILKSINSQV